MMTDAPGDQPKGRPGRRLRDRRALLVTLGLLAVLVLGGAGAVAVLQNRISGNIERFEDPFAALPTRPPAAVPPAEDGGADPAPATAPVNILVVGSDSRISAGDPSQWTRGAQRTDAIMLVHLAADRQSAHVMSIPRDSWVPIPGHGEAKINAAFSYGGPPLLVQTVEQLTQVRIDHVAVTDFESFTEITDALGGVNLDAGSGYERLSGEEALAYVRERYNLPRGDFDRVQRQQAWMRAMAQQLRDGGTLQDPTRWYGLLDAVSRSVSVDEGFSQDEMLGLLSSVRNLGSSQIGFLTVPVQGTGRSADGQSIVLLAQPEFDEFMAAVREDRIPAFLAEHPDALDQLTTAP